MQQRKNITVGLVDGNLDTSAADATMRSATRNYESFSG